jgi:hypothetical protein
MAELIHGYLGDGAYVTWNGHDFTVKANDHLNPTDQVVLDKEALHKLICFARRVGIHIEPGSITSVEIKR